jgi:hypothetical protein
MSDKRMLILPAEVVQKIDDNRGDISQAEFINLLIDNQLKEKEKDHKYATKEEVQVFQEDIKRLLRQFLDFYVSYGLEMGKSGASSGQPSDFEELTNKLQGLQKDIGPETELPRSGKATIKYK